MKITTYFLTVEETDNPTPAILETLDNPTEQDKWDLIKRVRDELLTQSDWHITYATEKGTAVPQNVLDYRQALRDIPQIFQNPEDVVFPTKP